MIPDNERAILVAILAAGHNANPDTTPIPHEEIVDAAFAQADLIVGRIEAERDARFRMVDGSSSAPREWPLA